MAMATTSTSSSTRPASSGTLWPSPTASTRSFTGTRRSGSRRPTSSTASFRRVTPGAGSPSRPATATAEPTAPPRDHRPRPRRTGTSSDPTTRMPRAGAGAVAAPTGAAPPGCSSFPRTSPTVPGRRGTGTTWRRSWPAKAVTTTARPAAGSPETPSPRARSTRTRTPARPTPRTAAGGTRRRWCATSPERSTAETEACARTAPTRRRASRERRTAIDAPGTTARRRRCATTPRASARPTRKTAAAATRRTRTTPPLPAAIAGTGSGTSPIGFTPRPNRDRTSCNGDGTTSRPPRSGRPAPTSRSSRRGSRSTTNRPPPRSRSKRTSSAAAARTSSAAAVRSRHRSRRWSSPPSCSSSRWPFASCRESERGLSRVDASNAVQKHVRG
mmetsp:Transcript_7725/g.19065  ORF Transcript_7725/g.19065 Transcript_7725/m.19065 type:complete len:387 (-) Transcript_7725:231-1391(-)